MGKRTDNPIGVSSVELECSFGRLRKMLGRIYNLSPGGFDVLNRFKSYEDFSDRNIHKNYFKNFFHMLMYRTHIGDLTPGVELSKRGFLLDTNSFWESDHVIERVCNFPGARLDKDNITLFEGCNKFFRRSDDCVYSGSRLFRRMVWVMVRDGCFLGMPKQVLTTPTRFVK